MAKLKKVTDSAPAAAEDLVSEAGSLLKRLIDEAQLREAVAKLIDEGQAVAGELPAKGRQARKQAKKEAKKRLKAAKKAAGKQQKKLAKQAAKQQKKLAKKGQQIVADANIGPKPKKRGPGLKGKAALLGVGGVGAVAVSESLRSKILDLLFGAEEEFQYTPPEQPAGQNPPPAV